MNSRARQVRCAIYTRVSTEQGLEQDFNSLDAQYDASQAYIRSQAHAGWTLIRSKYDDGGFSGGHTDRPALQRLLDDVRVGKVDVIVVYKVDRLTRSLADFAKLVELFDQHDVSFRRRRQGPRNSDWADHHPAEFRQRLLGSMEPQGLRRRRLSEVTRRRRQQAASGGTRPTLARRRSAKNGWGRRVK
jgi:DNA invertase Pin-like site-specific DNA recombinase